MVNEPAVVRRAKARHLVLANGRTIRTTAMSTEHSWPGSPIAPVKRTMTNSVKSSKMISSSTHCSTISYEDERFTLVGALIAYAIFQAASTNDDEEASVGDNDDDDDLGVRLVTTS